MRDHVIIVSRRDSSITRVLKVGNHMPRGFRFQASDMRKEWPWLCERDHLLPEDPSMVCGTCGSVPRGDSMWQDNPRWSLERK